MSAELYSLLAPLLSYPNVGYIATVGSVLAIGLQPSAIGHELTAFADAVAEFDLHALQELFIQTFDLNPVCSLEMGWHLFGENYDRGLLLVKIRQQLRAFGIAEGTELPDHLASALRLLARMERESGAYFAEAIVLPAVGKMLEAFRGKSNPYEHILNAVRLSICEEFPNVPEHPASETGPNELRVLA